MDERFVVITGGGSGIGRACAAAAVKSGLRVVAGVRDEAERAAVEDRGDEVAHVVQFDVTDANAVAFATRQIEKLVGDGRLAGLVNSAGIVVAGPLEYLPDTDLRRQFDVNVFGLMAVTRALLPLLRHARGRVVNIGSVGGRLSVPFTGAYCASKFAVRALSDALRVELQPCGVHVALIQPGAVDTPIWGTSMEAGSELLDRLGGDVQRDYGDQVDRMFEATRKAASRAIPPEAVATAACHALLAKRPRAQYLVGADAYAQALLAHVPARLRDPALVRIMGLAPGRSRDPS